jgi:transmembrane sensor
VTHAPEIPRDATQWWLRLGADTGLSAEEQAALDTWLAEDAANGAALDRCSETWIALDAFAGAPEIVTRRAEALEAMRRANRGRWSRPLRLPALAYAAAASLVAAIGAGGWYLAQDDSQQLATAMGERRALVLADGSRVSMDARTRVSIALGKAQRRLQVDSGRARFEVAYQPDRPFTVEIDGHVVIATGTSFSTEMVGGELHVIVYEGKVVVLKGAMPDPKALLALRHDPGDRAVALVPGQEFVARGATALVRKDAPGSSSWESGQLEFLDTPLSDAIEQFNRYSSEAITITDPRAANIKVNGIFKAGNSAAFLDAITRIHPIAVRRTRSGAIEISSSA